MAGEAEILAADSWSILNFTARGAARGRSRRRNFQPSQLIGQNSAKIPSRRRRAAQTHGSPPRDATDARYNHGLLQHPALRRRRVVLRHLHDDRPERGRAAVVLGCVEINQLWDNLASMAWAPAI